MSTFPWKSPPLDHQLKAIKRAWPHSSFGLYHAMGTGKTFTTINLAAARFRKDLIQGMIIICPTTIKLVWEEQLKEWCPVSYDVLTIESSTSARTIYDFNRKDTVKMKVLIVGIEALSQGKAFDHAFDFATRNTVMSVVDEASKIKNSQAGRTKKAIKIARRSVFRMILTGTPVTQGLQDLYAQMQFLDPAILGLKSYVLFRNLYCIMGGFENRNIVGYQRQEELIERILPHIDLVNKEDVLDLPPKVYEKRMVQPSKEQLVAIKELKDLFEAEIDGDILLTKTILERLTRYQQIIGGHFPFNDEDGGYDVKPLPKGSPKLRELMSVVEDEIPRDAKIIIWARFRPEIDMIARSLRAQYGGESVVELHGGIDKEGRKRAISEFRTNPNVKFFIANQATGGMGLTLIEATYVLYYSNSFSYEDRMQSEDRNHRKGQDKSVTYIDIEANHPYDKMILQAISKKGGLADYVNEKLR